MNALIEEHDETMKISITMTMIQIILKKLIFRIIFFDEKVKQKLNNLVDSFQNVYEFGHVVIIYEHLDY